jgi:hypothetical protein
MTAGLRRTLLITMLAGALGLLPARASATSFTNVYVFGDSLSDSGNVFLATEGAFPRFLTSTAAFQTALTMRIGSRSSSDYRCSRRSYRVAQITPLASLGWESTRMYRVC